MKRALIMLLILLVGCSSPDILENNNSWDGKPTGTATDHPSTDYDKFKEVKREIDYWYEKGPGQIGQKHHDQLLQRLSELSSIPQEEIEVYRQRLDAIVLVEEMPPQKQETSVEKQQASESLCEGTGVVTFTSPPMRIEDIEIIEPIGLMIGGHVTPIDHGYYYAKSWQSDRNDASTFVEVFAPAAGVIKELNSMPAEFATSSFGDYRFEIMHTCSFKTIYIHVNQLSE
ncbi:MAG: hypothetical protein AABX05_00420, partial [Nanoarchaeota archaeon]